MKKSCLVVCVLLCSLMPGWAGVILSDSFNYADGAITNVSGGVWIGHSSGNPVQVVSGQSLLAASTGEDVHAVLANQPYATSSGVTLYASFTVKFTALPSQAGTYFAHLNASTSHRCLVWTSTANAPSPGMFRLGIGNTTGANNLTGQLPDNLATNTTYTVVTRYNLGTGQSTLWLNPTNETDPSVTATDAVTTVSISNYSLRQNSGEGSLLLDNLIVGTNFFDVVTNAPPSGPPVITTQPQSQTVIQGDNVTFTVTASGAQPLSFQWQFFGTNLPGATTTALSLANVTTAQAGDYLVIVTNSAGATNSQSATLTVNPPPAPAVVGFSLLAYNVGGNGATDWSTNAAQVQAIARQLQYLNPDIITFNEIPYNLRYEMTNFVAAFMPGYSLAISNGGDLHITSAILSRYPITRVNKWLDGAELEPWGYTNTDFTRDLFEAQINVPGFPQPLHVFTTHLKATSGTTYADADAKRAAEAAAITNWFATNFFVRYPTHPYTLSGDMNAEETNYGTNTLAIQRLISAPMDLHLTNPTNPFTGSINTYSIKPGDSLNERIDYIFPCGLLFSNIAASQVFRTDKLNPVPPNLNSNDDKVASDHLPVMMLFNNPYDKPFRLTSITRSDPSVTLTWQSVFGQPYRVEASSNLTGWSVLASNLTATGNVSTLITNVTGGTRFFRVYRVP